MNGGPCLFGDWSFANRVSALHGVRREMAYWSSSNIPGCSLPTPHSTIFGIFRVVDVSTFDATAERESTASVDLAFGSDQRAFAGAHRLSVRQYVSDADLPKVTLCLSCVTCNPTSSTAMNTGVLKAFHNIYAKLLFSAALSRTIALPF